MADITLEVRTFAEEYPNVLVKEIATLKPGYVSCIKPVPGLFGPEIHCRPEDYTHVVATVALAVDS